MTAPPVDEGAFVVKPPAATETEAEARIGNAPRTARVAAINSVGRMGGVFATRRRGPRGLQERVTMPTVDQVREALAEVKDPELQLGILDLGLVYDVAVEGESGEH